MCRGLNKGGACCSYRHNGLMADEHREDSHRQGGGAPITWDGISDDVWWVYTWRSRRARTIGSVPERQSNWYRPDTRCLLVRSLARSAPLAIQALDSGVVGQRHDVNRFQPNHWRDAVSSDRSENLGSRTLGPTGTDRERAVPNGCSLLPCTRVSTPVDAYAPRTRCYLCAALAGVSGFHSPALSGLVYSNDTGRILGRRVGDMARLLLGASREVWRDDPLWLIRI